MKFTLICLSFLVTLAVQAQTKTQNTVNSVRKTSEDVKSVTDLGKELTGMFKKKTKAKPVDIKPADTAQVVKPATDTVKVVAGDLKTTLVMINGIDYPKLKTLNENIKACNGVESTVMKYDSKGSFITVSHKGTSEDLYKLITETSKDILTDKNLETLETGRIVLKL